MSTTTQARIETVLGRLNGHPDKAEVASAMLATFRRRALHQAACFGAAAADSIERSRLRLLAELERLDRLDWEGGAA